MVRFFQTALIRYVYQIRHELQVTKIVGDKRLFTLQREEPRRIQAAHRISEMQL